MKIKKENEFLKTENQRLRTQASCLMKVCIERDNEIWNLKHKIENLKKEKKDEKVRVSGNT